MLEVNINLVIGGNQSPTKTHEPLSDKQVTFP